MKRILLLSIVFSFSYSQSLLDSLLQYYPLQTGNIWVYQSTNQNNFYTKIHRITGDTIIGNKQFKVLRNAYSPYALGDYEFYRFDSSTNRMIKQYRYGYEIVIDSLIKDSSFQSGSLRMVSYLSDSLFSISIPSRLVIFNSEYYFSRAYRVGLKQYWNKYSTENSKMKLIYAKIKGVEYNKPKIDTLLEYHPMHIGNIWVYKQSGSSVLSFTEITGDTLLDGKSYRVFINYSTSSIQKEYSFYKIDTASGTIIQKIAGDETIVDSLFCPPQFGWKYYSFDSLVQETLFGQSVKVRYTSQKIIPVFPQFGYAYGIGKIYYSFSEEDPIYPRLNTFTSKLVYAKINGKEYGSKAVLISDSLSQYHPLQTGNTWTYRIGGYDYYDSTKTKYMTRVITGDSVIGNAVYKKVAEQWINKPIRVERFDDVTGNYYRGAHPDDLEDSTAASTPMTIFRKRQLRNVSPSQIFSHPTIIREITESEVIASTQYFYKYAHGFGLIEERLQGVSAIPSYLATLVYAKINGKEYGTNPLSVGEGQNNIPIIFSLSQNYPNPFNPATVINYQLPRQSNVLLKVFNVLGKEVATLVNEQKDAGTYSVQFDASSLASGLYFYQIRTGNIVETKKMLLIK